MQAVKHTIIHPLSDVQSINIGDSVTIKCGVQLWDGVRVEDNVFICPNVSFCNDKYPKSKNKNFTLQPIIKKGASIGAGAVILGGVTIGQNALIAAGSVVTKDISANVKFINGKVIANATHNEVQLNCGGGEGELYLIFANLTSGITLHKAG